MQHAAFTSEATRALAIAMEEARRLGSGHVGTEHLLMAVLRDEGGVSGAAIEALGARTGAVFSAAEKCTRPAASHDIVDRPFTSSLKRTLELAFLEAAEAGEHLVRPEHLFLGCVRAARNPAARVLADSGITLSQARASVARMRGRALHDPAPAFFSHHHSLMRQFRTFRERQARLDAWRERVRILLAESLSSKDQLAPDVAGLANTIVGMFDAGARDDEVIAFLREAEIRHFGEERLSASSRQVLARTLHRAAGDATD